MTAAGVLFELHHVSVFRTACAVSRNNDLAEDIAPQVLAELSRLVGHDATGTAANV